MDHFELLGVERKFGIDEVALERNYVELQQKFHPDRFNNRPANERAAVLQKATDINLAYEILSSPLFRAEYILELNGRGEEKKNINQEILMENMEMREALSDAVTKSEVENLIRDARKNREEIIKNLEKSFSQKDFPEAEEDVIRLKYIEKFLEEARIKKLQLENAA